MAKKSNNYTLGRGKVYISEESDLDVFNSTGERYVGNSPSLAINVESTSLDHMGSDGGISELDYSVTTGVNRGGTLGIDNIDMDNLAMFFLGVKSTVSQAATPVVDEPHMSVIPGLFYQLGVTATNPQGVRNVGSVVVKDDVAVPTTYILNTDYEVDLVEGRVYIIPGGGIAALTNLEISYTPVAGARDRVISGSRPKRGRLRYIEDNPAGLNRTMLLPLVEISPSGDFDLKGDAWRTLSFSLKPLKRMNFEAIYIDGLPVA